MALAGILGIVFLVSWILRKLPPRPCLQWFMVLPVCRIVQLCRYDAWCIWADQSWGRFWEGSKKWCLLIVIWSASATCARSWSGGNSSWCFPFLVYDYRLVLAWHQLLHSLHSYGFSEAGFRWLMIFNASQVILMCLVLVPANLGEARSKSALSQRLSLLVQIL